MMKFLILIIAIFAICNANPVKEEILAKINQLSELRTQINQARDAFLKFHEVAAQTHRVHTEIIENSKTQRDSRATAECLSAIDTLTRQLVSNGTCSSYVNAYFATSTSSSDKQTAVTNFCSNCAQPFTQAVRNVIAQCNVSDFSAALLRSVGFYPRFLCAQAEGKFCSNVINEVVTQVPNDITQISDSILAKICTPCISVALNVLQQGNLVANEVYFKSVIILRGVCVKIGGKFCFGQIRDNFNTLIQVGAKINSTDINGGDFKKVLDFFCNPCYRLVSARLALSNGFSALAVLKGFTAVGALCRKNAAKEYCLIKIFNEAKQFLASAATGGKIPCSNIFDGGNVTCSADCQNVVKNFVNRGGCCWAVLADFASGVGPGADDSKKSDFYKAIRQCVPDITIPEPCVSVAKATIKLTYTNINVNTGNQQAFIQAVLNDLAIAVGQYDSVTTASITVSTNKRANEATISVPVTTSGTLGATLNVPETTCNAVCATVPIVDPSSEVSVRSETSGLTIQSSSSILSFSFALLFILSIFFF